MALLELRGRYAVGKYRYTIVDDDMLEELSRWAWQVRPNGKATHFYATRTSKLPDGRTVTIRMHRVALGYDGPLDVDHINRNTLDNRRENLRAVPRAVNVRNTSDWAGTGPHCKWPRVELKPPKPYVPKVPPAGSCAWCGRYMEVRAARHCFCSEPCRKAAKWIRQRDAGQLPSSACQTPPRYTDPHQVLSAVWANRGNSPPDLALVPECHFG